jgi:hypothetical protein
MTNKIVIYLILQTDQNVFLIFKLTPERKNDNEKRDAAYKS